MQLTLGVHVFCRKALKLIKSGSVNCPTTTTASGMDQDEVSESSRALTKEERQSARAEERKRRKEERRRKKNRPLATDDE